MGRARHYQDTLVVLTMRVPEAHKATIKEHVRRLILQLEGRTHGNVSVSNITFHIPELMP
jgi:hypothetical protein